MQCPLRIQMAEREYTVLPLEPTTVIPTIRIHLYTDGLGRRHEALSPPESSLWEPGRNTLLSPRTPTQQPARASPPKRPQPQCRPAPARTEDDPPR
jgi:hypothetical protein